MRINVIVLSIFFNYFMKKWADRLLKDRESNVEDHGEAQSKILKEVIIFERKISQNE